MNTTNKPQTYKGCSIEVTKTQLDWMDSNLNYQSQGNDCTYFDVECLADTDNDYSTMPEIKDIVSVVLEYCEEENLQEIMFYC